MRKKIALILIGSCNLFCVLQSGIDTNKQSLSFVQKFIAQVVAKSQQRFLSSPTSIVAPCLTREEEDYYAQKEIKKIADSDAQENLKNCPVVTPQASSGDSSYGVEQSLREETLKSSGENLEEEENQSSLFLELQKFVAQKNLKKLKRTVGNSNAQEESNDCPVTPIVTPQGSRADLSDCVVQSPRGKTPMNDSRELLRVISLVRSQSIRGCVVGSPEPESLGDNLEEDDFGYFCDVEMLSPTTRGRRRSSSSEEHAIRSFRSQNFDSVNSLGSCCFGSSSNSTLNECPVPTPTESTPEQR